MSLNKLNTPEHVSFCTLHTMHCTFVSVSYLCIFAIDHAEPELKESRKQAQDEDFTNIVWIKASPGAFNQCPYLLI
jgi:hypothetical protein